jgi:CRP-like cAMP-binding protein
MFKHDQKIERLRDIELLAACSMQELRTIASIGDHVFLHSGDVLPGLDRTFVLLTEGDAEAGGSHLSAGDSCGSVALLGGRPGPSAARMTSDGNALVVGPREFTTLMRRAPGFALGIARALAHRMGHVA